MTIFRPRTLVPNPSRRGFLVAAVVPHSSDGGLIEEVINRKTFTPYRGDAPYSRIVSPFGPAMKASGTTTRLCFDTDDSKEWQVTRLPMCFWGVTAFRYNLEGGGGSAQTDRLMAELRGSEDTLKMDTSGTGDYAGALHFDRADEGTGAIFRSANGILVPGAWYIVAAKFGAVEDDVELWVNGEKKALTKSGSGFVKSFGRMTLYGGWNVNALAAVIAYRGSEIPYEAKVDPWWAFRPATRTVLTLPVIVPPPVPLGLAPHFGKFDEETSTEVFLSEANAAEAFEAQLLEDGEDPVALTTSIDSGHWMVTLPSQAAAKTVGIEVKVQGSVWAEVPGGFEYYDQSAPAPAPEAAPAIATSRTSGHDPFGIVVSGSGTTWTGVAKPFHHLAYLWDFGDPSGFLNRVSGPVASHVYETPGTYTVTLRVFRPGQGFGEASAEVVVTNQETVFSGATWVFSTSGDFTGKPAGATEVTTSSWNTVLSYAAAGRRLLLRRGETFTSAGTPANVLAGNVSMVGAFGAPVGEPDALGRYGNDPVVQLTGTAASVYLTQIGAIAGLTFDHVVFEDAEEGSAGYRWGCGPSSWNNHQDDLTWHKCAFKGFYSPALLGDRTVDYVERTGLLFSRCYLDSTDYGLYIRGVLGAVAACYFEDTAVHNVRITLGVDFAVHDCPRIGESQDLARHSIKLHAQSASEATPAARYVSISRNFFDASNNWQVSIGPQNAESDEFVEDVVIDGNGHNHPADRLNQATWEVSARNVTIRNNWVVDQRATTDYAAHVLVHRRGTGLGYMPSGVEVYNNSIFSRRTGGTGYVALLEVQDHDGAVITRGNILYAPAKTPAYLVAAILAGGQSHDGSANLISATTDPLFTSTTPGSEDLTLQAGSPAIGAGVAFGGLVFDGAGLVRPQESLDQGAHERGASAYSWPTGWEGPEGNETPAGPIPLGINIHVLDASNTSRALINLCKMATPWRFWDGENEVVPEPEELDADGYPLALPAGIENAYSIVQADLLGERRVPEAVALGWHVITFEGSGRVDLLLYKPGQTPLVHADVPSGFAFLNPNGHIQVYLASIDPEDHLRNFRITEARFAGSPGVSFTPEFLNSLGGFSAIRGPLQWYIDNAYDSTLGTLTWAKRTTPSRYTYVGTDAEPHAWPWELMVELANLLGVDLYTMIPYFAADDYVAGMVGILAGVGAGQKVWLEYSNEAYHGPELSAFKNCAWFRAQALLLFEVDPEDPVDVLMTQLKAHAHHGIRIFDLVMAHEDYDAGVFKFLATYPSSLPDYALWLGPALNYTPVATAWKAYLAGVLTSFYWGASWLPWNGIGFDLMLDACDGDVDLFATYYVFPALEAKLTTDARLTAFKDYLTGESVASGALYEFGPDPNHPFISYERVGEFFELYRAFTRSDRQRRMMVWLLNRLASWLNAALPSIHFADVAPYQLSRPWGMAEDQLDTSAPRLTALRSYLTLGDPIPSLEPASLDPSFGGLGEELVTEIAWVEAPPAAETFFARMNGSTALTTVIEDGVWKITLPEKATGQVALIEISLDEAIWFTIPGGFTYIGEVTPLLPTGLGEPSGVDDQPVTTEVLLALKPSGITEFFARSGATALTAEIVGEEWRVTLPARRSGLFPAGLNPDSGEMGQTHRVRILPDPLTVPVEISIDALTWVPVPGGYTYNGYPTPEIPGTFYGQVYKGPTYASATAAVVGVDGIWRMTLPAWATEETVGVQIGTDGMTWTEVPGGFRFIRGLRFLGMAFLAYQAARGRIGRRR